MNVQKLPLEFAFLTKRLALLGGHILFANLKVKLLLLRQGQFRDFMEKGLNVQHLKFQNLDHELPHNGKPKSSPT